MAARSEVSKRNRYWIDKHRHYELKHFCLQYPSWKKLYTDCLLPELTSNLDYTPSGNGISDSTSRLAIKRVDISSKIHLIEKTAREVDGDLHEYILRAVTEGLSYTYLKSKLDIPCSRDTYYDRYRRFFWKLDKVRN